ncbi:MAG: class I SAM-dependent methyltransferase [Promethearchaeota archaeon]
MIRKNKKYYDLLHQNEWKNISDYGPSCRSRYRILLKLFKKFNFSKKKILEVGASAGNLSIYFIRKLKIGKFYSTDFSKESVKLMKKKGLNNIFVADLYKLNNFKEKDYSTIICSEVLEHIKHDEKAINTIYQLLKKGGKALISVPYLMKYWTKHDDFSGHFRRYEQFELERKLKNIGFKIEKSIVWGALFYNLYYILLGSMKPSSVMSSKKPNFLKRILAKFLYFIFILDDLLTFTKRGRRLFIVAIKE